MVRLGCDRKLQVVAVLLGLLLSIAHASIITHPHAEPSTAVESSSLGDDQESVLVCFPGLPCHRLPAHLVTSALAEELDKDLEDYDEDAAEPISLPVRRSSSGGSYLFRSRRAENQGVARRSHGYLLRTRKSVDEDEDDDQLLAPRDIRGEYLFRTRKDATVPARSSRAGYLFRTRKADQQMDRMLRSKGYLFRTRKSTNGDNSIARFARGGSYLFRT